MQLCLLIPKLHLFSEVRWVRDEGRALSKEIQVLQEMTVATCTPSTSPRRPGMNEGGLPQCDLVTTSRTAQAKHHRWNAPCIVQHFPSFTLLRDRLLPRAWFIWSMMLALRCRLKVRNTWNDSIFQLVPITYFFYVDTRQHTRLALPVWHSLVRTTYNSVLSFNASIFGNAAFPLP